MKSGTRSKMVMGAADLMRRRGVNATSVREVVRHTGTPRGSIGHHFPQGKAQLVEEAVLFAGREVSEPLAKLINERGPRAGLRAFIELWRNVLESTHYEAGCPVLAVAVEEYLGEDGTPDEQVQQRLMMQAKACFHDWQSILSASLRNAGVSPVRARRLAVLVISAVEGTVALCRASKSSQALDDVRIELEGIMVSALDERT